MARKLHLKSNTPILQRRTKGQDRGGSCCTCQAVIAVLTATYLHRLSIRMKPRVWEQSIRVKQTDMFKKPELWSSPEGSENTSYLDFLNKLKS